MTEHAFAPYVRTLGRGRRGARALTRDEAEDAMGMILDGEATPEQVGAFLMLLRVKEETAAEIAGFVAAARARCTAPAAPLAVDLDWPSYAGKRQQSPWFLLAALLLARHGHRVLMHGCAPHASDRLFSGQALAALGIAAASDWDDAARQLRQHGFAYLPLAHGVPRLQQLLDLRRVLGLRSPVNTFVRHLNPLRATATLQSLHHPAYAALHAEATQLLAQPRALIFKGDGGECELRPDAESRCLLVTGDGVQDVLWPRQLDARANKSAHPSAAALRALWSGTLDDAYGTAAVTGTAALALLAMGRESTPEAALAAAALLWQNRGPWEFSRQ